MCGGIATERRSSGWSRQEWLPLFDRHGVDLIVCGHKHHYERTNGVRGVDPAGATTLRPMVVSDRLDVIDTSRGLVEQHTRLAQRVNRRKQ